MDFLLSSASWRDPIEVIPELKDYKSVTLSPIIDNGELIPEISYRIINIKSFGALLVLACKSRCGIVLRRANPDTIVALKIAGVFYEIVLYDDWLE